MKRNNYKTFILFIILLLLLTSIKNLAQDKMEGHNHNNKMEMHKADKDNCNNQSGMNCCSSNEMSTKEKTVLPWNEVCPVKGNKVDKDIKTVEYNEKHYGFCCEGCDDKFAKDPSKYSHNLSSDGKKFTKKS